MDKEIHRQLEELKNQGAIRTRIILILVDVIRNRKFDEADAEQLEDLLEVLD